MGALEVCHRLGLVPTDTGLNHLVDTRSEEADNESDSWQIMDSKMDSGYLGPGQNQNLEDDYDITRDLSAEEVLGVMDELLCYEVRARFRLRYIREEVLGCIRGFFLLRHSAAMWFRWLGIWDIHSRKRS